MYVASEVMYDEFEAWLLRAQHLVVKFNSFHKIKRPSTEDDDDDDDDEADDENVAETDDACVEPVSPSHLLCLCDDLMMSMFTMVV